MKNSESRRSMLLFFSSLLFFCNSDWFTTKQEQDEPIWVKEAREKHSKLDRSEKQAKEMPKIDPKSKKRLCPNEKEEMEEAVLIKPKELERGTVYAFFCKKESIYFIYCNVAECRTPLGCG